MTDQENKERLEHAYSDPEIQTMIQDPLVQQLFKELQENPQAA